MSNQPDLDEEALAKLLSAAIGPAARLDAKQREEGWTRLQQVFRAEQAHPETVQDISVEPAHNGTPDATHVAGWLSAAGRKKQNTERNSLMKLFIRRPLIGWGAAMAAAAIVAAALLSTPRAQARAIEVMSRGARAIASLSSIHLKGQLRTLPSDNFSYIDPNSDFYPIELWKQFTPELKWRVEKPGRIAVMDGKSTVHYIKPSNTGVRVEQAAHSAFDTDWLHRIANLSQTVADDLQVARAKGWKLSLASETAPDGRKKAVVTIVARTDIPEGDYVKNSFFGTADTRRVYRFDETTERLEGVEIYLLRKDVEIPIFQLTDIEYDQAFPEDTWKLNLPKDVQWIEPVRKIPNNEAYAAMTPEAAARAFFEACSREDWAEAAKFRPINASMKERLGGLELISLGTPFISKAYSGQFVPYEIKLRPTEAYIRLSKDNPAKRFVITGTLNSKFEVEENTIWETPPAILPDNAAYQALSAADAAKAFAEAWSRLDWEALLRFCPAAAVEKARKQVEEASKTGTDLKSLLPVFEMGEAFWSVDQRAWLVKCKVFSKRKHNLSLRNDNPAGRWQVDGGL
jgi:hypothetical protein